MFTFVGSDKGKATGAGGAAVSANSVTFPAAIKYGISMSEHFFGWCFKLGSNPFVQLLGFSSPAE